MENILGDHLANLIEEGFVANTLEESGQGFVEIGGLSINSPPWNHGRANILFPIPTNYPIGGLDAFYVEQPLFLFNGQKHPRMQSEHNILGRRWWLVSWHYVKPWSPANDSLITHLLHCKQFFKQGERSQ